MSGIKKQKRFIITVAKKFLSYHSKSGEQTGFAEKIIDGTKIHTIRPNFSGWEKKFKEIELGHGYLIVNQWTGLPYRTPQENVKTLTVNDGVGIEKLTYRENEGLFINDNIPITTEELAVNDGLSADDFNEWFKVFPTEPLAIIHFTDFRYSRKK